MSDEIEYIRNQKPSSEKGPDFLSPAECAPVFRLHASAPGYSETPLVRLSDKANALGVKGIYVKNEAPRFGLNAFKGLGGIYAIYRLICEKLGLDIGTTLFEDLQKPENLCKIQELVFISTTDGNHGKGVAWAAGLLGCRAHIFMPKGTVPARVKAIEAVGKADVTVTDMGYDDTVRYTRELASKNGWNLVQDTSCEGYEKIPSWIIQGYTTMVEEALNQLKALGENAPTHVFLQAGVGSMAAAAAGYLINCLETVPVISVVEPSQAACFYDSARIGDGLPHAAAGNGNTIMAGLNCAEPCSIAWPILRDYAAFCLSCPDYTAAEGMRQLALPTGADEAVTAGESGASAAGAAFLILERPEYSALREQMKLDGNSVILLFNTEGNTDPDNYEKIMKGAFPLPE